MTSPIAAHLKPHREKPLAHGHPWVFSGAIARWSRRPAPGACVEVYSSENRWMGRGFAQPDTDLAIRIYSRVEQAPLDSAWLAARLDAALALRARLFPDPAVTDAYRLVFSEADGLSGLIVDRYADVLAIHVGTASLLPHLPFLRDHLLAATGLRRCLCLADRDAVTRERLDAAAVAACSIDGEGVVRIREQGFQYEVDLAAGQKTGAYLDQRENRARVARYAPGRSILSAYCYTGGFELHAAHAGATSITGLDSSAPALERARHHHALNNLSTPIDYREADVPLALRSFRDAARSFDLIVLDPPRFVQNTAQRDRGLRAYKDINLLALKLLSKGGILATFSCSGLVGASDLERVIQWAAEDSGRTVRILETLGQPADHPSRPGFPEATYLCGYIVHAE